MSPPMSLDKLPCGYCYEKDYNMDCPQHGKSMSLDERLREVVYTYSEGHISDEQAILAIKKAVADAMPKEKAEDDCGCSYAEGCGCTVEDYNLALSDMMGKLEGKHDE